VIIDPSGNRRFYGVYRGTVTNSKDPKNKRRIKATVPQVLGKEPTDWAWPTDDSSFYSKPPKIGQGVWVMFEGGDPSFPIWSGTFGSYKGVGTQLELTDLPKSSYPETISNNVSSGKFDVVSAVVDISNRLETEISEADFPAGGLEGQILAKLSDGNEGFINLLGEITKLNTSAFTVGTVLFIDPATPGALTSTEPVSPQLDMSVAIVTRQHPTTGIIFVRMWNQGVDLGEVNDVKITTPADGQVLTYDSSTNIWVNEAIPPIPQAVPTGVVSQFAGSTAPSGYLMCDGAAVSRSTHSALFTAIGTTYGVGNGTTTFNLPNLQNRVPVGRGSGTFANLNASGGTETVTLSELQIPSHTHTTPNHSHTYSTTTSENGNHSHAMIDSYLEGDPAGSGQSTAFAGNRQRSGYNDTRYIVAAGAHTHTLSGTTSNASPTTNGTGGGQAHNNLQPYIVLNYIIKT
jgi:microcystin-dependent protein